MQNPSKRRRISGPAAHLGQVLPIGVHQCLGFRELVTTLQVLRVPALCTKIYRSRLYLFLKKLQGHNWATCSGRNLVSQKLFELRVILRYLAPLAPAVVVNTVHLLQDKYNERTGALTSVIYEPEVFHRLTACELAREPGHSRTAFVMHFCARLRVAGEKATTPEQSNSWLENIDHPDESAKHFCWMAQAVLQVNGDVDPKWWGRIWKRTEDLPWGGWLRRWVLRQYKSHPGDEHLPNRMLVSSRAPEVFPAVLRNLRKFPDDPVPDHFLPVLLENWRLAPVQDILEQLLRTPKFYHRIQQAAAHYDLSWAVQIQHQLQVVSPPHRLRLLRIFGYIQPKLLQYSMDLWAQDFTDTYQKGHPLAKYICVLILSRDIFTHAQIQGLVEYLQSIDLIQAPVWWPILGVLTVITQPGLFAVVLQMLDTHPEAVKRYLLGISTSISIILESAQPLENLVETTQFQSMHPQLINLSYAVLGVRYKINKIKT